MLVGDTEETPPTISPSSVSILIILDVGWRLRKDFVFGECLFEFQSLLFWMLVGDFNTPARVISVLMNCFNPYYSGCWLATNQVIDGIKNMARFQSLLFWMLVGDIVLILYIALVFIKFQSLLFWMLVGDFKRSSASFLFLVCFNPYYSGCWFQSLLFWMLVGDAKSQP